MKKSIKGFGLASGLVAAVLAVAGCRPTPYGRAVGDGLLIHAAREKISGELNPYDRGGGNGGSGGLQYIKLPNGEVGWVNKQNLIIVSIQRNKWFHVYDLNGNPVPIKGVYTADNPFNYRAVLNK